MEMWTITVYRDEVLFEEISCHRLTTSEYGIKLTRQLNIVKLGQTVTQLYLGFGLWNKHTSSKCHYSGRDEL